MELGVDIELLKMMIDAGVDPHQLSAKHYQSPLDCAISLGRPDYLRFLLELGIDPNNDIKNRRLGFAAVGQSIPVDKQLALLKLLVEYHLDLNHLYEWFGNRNILRTVLDHATEPEVKKYLRSVGAKTAAELTGKVALEAAESSGNEQLAEVHRHLEKLFGPAEERSFTEMLDPDSPISVHVIKPTSDDGFITLFTLGLSSKPMAVPPELAEHALAELYLQLPANWEFNNPDPRWSWPIQLLVDLANYPHANDGFFAVPVTAISNGSPPEPLGPGVKFTATALVADEGFQRADGNTVHLFCVMPIFDSECKLAQHSIPEFLNRLDAVGVSRILSLNRPGII